MIDRKPNLHSRREILRQMAGTGLCVPFARILPALALEQQTQNPAGNGPTAAGLSPEDDQFLNDVENASFLFFWEQGSPNTGMVKDRCNVRTNKPGDASSIAATGFGLTALCIGAQRGYISGT